MKKALRNILLLILVLVLIRGWLFRATVQYHQSTTLPTHEISNRAFLQFIDKQQVEPKIQAIAKKSLRLSASLLRFTFDKCDTEPNLLFASQKTNCVGYASFFSTTCQALLAQNQLEKRFSVQHVRGNLTFFGQDVHRWFHSPFFRDHDYNVIQDLQTGEKIYVDASTFDVLGIGYVRGD